MKPLIKIILSLLLTLTFFSCSSKKKDYSKAVSVFGEVVAIKADNSIANLKIQIPAAKPNQSWSGQNNDNNSGAENFSFTNKITKVKSIWTGYRPSYGDNMVSSPIIAENIIYLLDAKGNLSARNLEGGKIIWSKKLIKWRDVRNFTNGKISYQNGKIFASTGYDLVLAINSKNGEIIWSKNIGAITISAPVSNENQIFITTNDNKTYALNSDSGEINWVHSGIVRNTGILGSANPVFYKDYIITAYSSGEIYALNKNNGEALWSQTLNIGKAINSDFILNDVDSTPIVKDDIVYTIGNGGLMMAIAIKDGHILWKKELATITDTWISGDFIYLITNDNQLICLYKKTGEIKWIKDLEKYANKKNSSNKIVYNGIIMAGSNLILSNSNREVLIISPFNGDILQTIKTEQKIYHTPVIVNKKLYLQTIGRFTVNLMVME